MLWHKKDYKRIQRISLSANYKYLYCGINPHQYLKCEISAGEFVKRIPEVKMKFDSEYKHVSVLEWKNSSPLKIIR